MTPNTKYSTDPAFALTLDREDPLQRFRNSFIIPEQEDGTPQIYLCGNSLGLQPTAASDYVRQELDDWAELGVEGHFRARHPWMRYHESLAESSAAIVGAHPDEIVVMNTLTVNLHLMMVSFYRPTRERYKIIIEEKAFPSDQYAVASQAQFHGYDPADAIVEIPMDEHGRFSTEHVLETIDRHADDTALLLLGGVNYYNGQLFDVEEITRHARAASITVGIDLAHAAGNVPLKLHDWGVDFAAWCSYKYLNSGPGSTAGCFVHQRHATNASLPRFAGWWGHDKSTRFDMPDRFTPIPGAEGWQLSNPAILPMATLRASLDLFMDAGMAALRRKSELLTGYLEYLLLHGENDSWNIITPSEPEQRGCQLSLRISSGGKQLFDHLGRSGVICDWREPDVIRIAPVPLYNSFTDVHRFAELFHQYFTDHA
ncbi:MAG: kynureninase [Ignavibacteria bacterium]|nr:MAG: kynureninase [Ignavibacteria bacterium]